MKMEQLFRMIEDNCHRGPSGQGEKQGEYQKIQLIMALSNTLAELSNKCYQETTWVDDD